MQNYHPGHLILLNISLIEGYREELNAELLGQKMRGINGDEHTHTHENCACVCACFPRPRLSRAIKKGSRQDTCQGHVWAILQDKRIPDGWSQSGMNLICEGKREEDNTHSYAPLIGHSAVHFATFPRADVCEKQTVRSARIVAVVVPKSWHVQLDASSGGIAAPCVLIFHCGW